MQRHFEEGVVIACDFCGLDWDEITPMIEGHQGSVICINCLEKAIQNTSIAVAPFKCTMCLRELEGSERKFWAPGERNERANQNAVICYSCIRQATRGFAKDPDMDWTPPEASVQGGTGDDEEDDDE